MKTIKPVNETNFERYSPVIKAKPKRNQFFKKEAFPENIRIMNKTELGRIYSEAEIRNA